MKNKTKDFPLRKAQIKLNGCKNPILLSDIINIVIATLSLVGICISAWSVHQMKEDRRSAYKPDILINPYEIKILWNKDGLEQWVQISSDENPSIENEDDPFSSSIIESILKASLDALPIANIGVGTAKNISVSWDSGNIRRLLNKLIEYDTDYSSFCTIRDNAVIFSFHDHLVQVSNVTDSFYMYMLPSAEKDSELFLTLPLPYSIIIQELIKQPDFYFNKGTFSPSLFMNLSYEDILGNQYSDLIALKITRSLYSTSSDGSGYAVLEIIPSYGKR